VLARLHIVRHGEVHNPDGIVYADLPGFGLSALGRRQAAAAGSHLDGEPIVALWSSPLQRAVETAQLLPGAEQIHTDPRLTEWELGSRWGGVAWNDLPDRFPGELEAYLDRPTDLDFAPESIGQVAARMVAVVADLGAAHPGGTAVVVTHQDPAQAVRLSLTGRPLTALQRDKPGHACVITLTAVGSEWSEDSAWCPEQAPAPFPPVEDATAT
jgi:broad specificity phosphatase PhoE